MTPGRSPRPLLRFVLVRLLFVGLASGLLLALSWSELKPGRPGGEERLEWRTLPILVIVIAALMMRRWRQGGRR